MRSVGNAVANEYWESRLPSDFDRPDSSNTYQMSVFIKHKYMNKKWAARGPPPGTSALIGSHVKLGAETIPGPTPHRAMPERCTSSGSELTLEDIFGKDDGTMARSVSPVVRERKLDGVSSKERKPGTKIPERLARKLRNQRRADLVVVAQRPTGATSEPNLAALAGPDPDDDDDPFS
jgi:hypothetical protein